MRIISSVSVASIASILLLCFSLSGGQARAKDFDAKLLDEQSLDALKSQADQAPLSERCFLYAEIVHQMTELAGRQVAAGDSPRAADTLQAVRDYAAKIHADISQDARLESRKVKNAELLMEHTVNRLNGILNTASYEDRDMMALTLKQLNQIQTELMLQVFKK
jgi:hypothetical protein